MIKKFATLSLIFAIFTPFLNAKIYELDKANSFIKFKVTHLSINEVFGEFGDFSATIDLNHTTPKRLKASILADSINTHNKGRDSHLYEGDFLDIVRFSSIKFEMSDFNQTAENSGKIAALITIKDITKPAVFNYEFKKSNILKDGREHIEFVIFGAINRRDFDIATTTSDAQIGEKVEIKAKITASAQRAE